MPTIHTLGHPSKQIEFTYTGSVTVGVTLDFTGEPMMSAEFFRAILNCFKGSTVKVSFNMTGPLMGGFGTLVDSYSQVKNTTGVSQKHASFIAAILVHEGYISTTQQGNAVYLHFPDPTIS